MSAAMDFALRSAVPGDIVFIHALQQRIERHDGIPIVTPRDEFEEWLEEPHFDLTKDARVLEIGEEIVAWGRIWHPPSGVREERAYLTGGVDPRYRGKGIGSAVLRWQIERATEALRSLGPALPKFIRTYAFDFEHARLRL